MQISASAFGGALPWARVILVERRRWLLEEEFVDILSLCQFVPDPNIINLSVAVGQKFSGAMGALMAFVGLLWLPFILTILLAMGYTRLASTTSLSGFFAGVAAAGLFLSMAGKMIQRQMRSRPGMLLFSVAAFLGVGIFHLHILIVLLVLAPPRSGSR